MDLEFLSSSTETQMDWITTNYNHNDQIPHQELFEPNPSFPIQFSSHADKPITSVQKMREMVFCMAALQPIHVDPESIKPLKRRNVKISKDPQSVAARLRREKISERIRILQRLVPGGTKMDTASMLDEAVQYLKFLKNQVQSMERVAFVDRGRVTQTGMVSTDDSGRVDDKILRKGIIY